MPNFRLRTLASTRMRRVAALAMLRRNVVLLGLPPRVAIFYSRARRAAARSGDRWSLESATGPRSLALLLRAARGRRRVVEIGTGTAWTTAALALADHKRRVLSFDPTVWPERDRYLRLAGPEAATRIQLVLAELAEHDVDIDSLTDRNWAEIIPRLVERVEVDWDNKPHVVFYLPDAISS